MGLYIRVLNNFYTHRKTMRLRASIGDAAFWVPPRLWAYASENQPDGCFSDYKTGELALLIGYTGNANTMLEALLEARFFDANPLRIHDWEEHNGYHATFSQRAKKAAAARWGKNNPPIPPESTVQERKGKEASNARILPSNASSIEELFPSPPRARFERPGIESVLLNGAKIGLPDAECHKFFHFYEANGWRVGKNPMKNWASAMINWRSNFQNGTYGNQNKNAGGNSAKGFDRNKGTFNEGKSHLYQPKPYNPV